MNRNYRVITVNGIRGLIAALFCIAGLIAGFVISPGWVCMKTWNHFFEYSSTLSVMNIWQGIMLWAVIALSLYALNNKRTLIGFGSYKGLTPEQIKEVIRKAKEAESIFEKSAKEGENEVSVPEDFESNKTQVDTEKDISCCEEIREETRNP